MRGYAKGFFAVNALFLVAMLALFCWPMEAKISARASQTNNHSGDHSGDHPGAIGDDDWYMSFRRSRSTQALDRNVMYHDIGRSMQHARDADIVILGHSMALFALDWRVLREFSARYGLKIYNLASGGDASGEFLLRVALKNGLRPKIWLINADDHDKEFFSEYLSDIARGEAADVVSYGRVRAFLDVASNDLKWRFELFLRALLPRPLATLIYPVEPIFNYRSARDGNARNDDWPGYQATNPPLVNAREPDCHASTEVIATARKYAQRLGSGEIMLTLIPYANSCRTRVREIAEALGVPFLSVDWKGMTTFDNGGHLDAAGAKKFTEALLEELVKTEAFHRAFPGRAPGSALK
jgi:hypothetical protein